MNVIVAIWGVVLALLIVGGLFALWLSDRRARSRELLCAAILALPEEEQSAAIRALFGSDCETALRRVCEYAARLAEGEMP